MAWLMRFGFDGWARIVTVRAIATKSTPKVVCFPIFFTETSLAWPYPRIDYLWRGDAIPMTPRDAKKNIEWSVTAFTGCPPKNRSHIVEQPSRFLARILTTLFPDAYGQWPISSRH